ncbi:MAG: hypothetical protein JWN44_3487 [Myxococcales bacterium]|nr:hypothetical protein [Myxococcales bacterium]
MTKWCLVPLAFSVIGCGGGGTASTATVGSTPDIPTASVDGGVDGGTDGGTNGGEAAPPSWFVTSVPSQGLIMSIWGANKENVVAIDDHGAIWSSSGDDQWSLAQDTGFDGAGLNAVTGDSGQNLFAGGWSRQLWHSSDAGRSWALVPTSKAIRINALGLANGVLIVGAEEGLYSSRDGGRSLVAAGGVTDPVNGVYAHGDAVYAVGVNQTTSLVTAYTSRDAGLTFRAVALDQIHRWTTGGIWSDGAGTVFLDGNAMEPPGVPAKDATQLGYVAVSHDDGASFVSQELSPPMLLVRAWGTSASDVWISGVGRQLAHFDGTTWTRSVLPGTSPPDGSWTTLSSIWGTAADDIYVGGDHGLIAHLRRR